MKAWIVILGIVLMAAFINVESAGALLLIMVAVYVVSTIMNKKQSVVELVEDKPSLLSKLDKMELKVSNGAVDRVLTDFGAVTASFVQGKDADVSGKALLGTTHQITQDATNIIKESSIPFLKK